MASQDQAFGQRLTQRELGDFMAWARAKLATGQSEIDLSSITQVDSFAVTALLALVREAGGSPPAFLNPSPNLRKLANLYGVEQMLL